MKRISHCKICKQEKTKWVTVRGALLDGYFKCSSCSNRSTRSYREDNPVARLWSSCKSRSKRLGLPFTLLQEDIVIPEYCPILGLRLDISYKERSEGTPSIDRIDNTKGYTKDNIVVTSWRANRLKNNGSIDELAAIVYFYTQLVPSK